MAGDLVYKSTVPHTFIQDLESAFYILLWQSVHYISCRWTAEELTGLHVGIGDEAQVDTHDSRKIGFMSNPNFTLFDLEFSVANSKHSPLGKLLRDFANVFCPKYRAISDRQVAAEKIAAEKIRYEEVLKIFSDALKLVDDWPSMDFVINKRNRLKLQQDSSH